MIFWLRLFGVLSAIGTVIYAIVLVYSLSSPARSGGVPGGIVYTIGSLVFTVLWFWLASKVSRRRRAAWEYAMSLPCQQCGSTAAIGFRVCSTCGRVKAAGL